MLQHNAKATTALLPRGAALVREVEMEVVFGTPSKNCSGAGICLIANRSPYWQTIPCPHAPAIIHYPPGPELVFRFRKRYLSPETELAFFRRDFFVIEEAFRLPQRLVRQWNLSAEWIQPGHYAVEEYSQEWRLYFTL